tara:strand:+ start:21 stop:287 length:267 start_codon:yes stop_codon:yes gene_type:complete
MVLESGIMHLINKKGEINMSDFEKKQVSFNEAVVQNFDDFKKIWNNTDKIIDIQQNQISDLKHDLKVLSIMFFAVSFFFIIAIGMLSS